MLLFDINFWQHATCCIKSATISLFFSFQAARQLGRLSPWDSTALFSHLWINLASGLDDTDWCHRPIKCKNPQKFGRRASSLKSNFNKRPWACLCRHSEAKRLTVTPSNSLGKQATVFCHCCIDVSIPSSLDLLSSHFPACPSPLPCSDSRARANQLNKVSRYGENKSTIVEGFLSLSISSRTLEATCHLL